MHIMYVDESGDTGREPGSTPVFALAGLISPASKWGQLNDAAFKMRKELESEHGFRLKEELRGSAIMRREKTPPHRRLEILLSAVEKIAALPNVSLIMTAVKKDKLPIETDVFRAGWTAHLTRYDAWLAAKAGKGRQARPVPGMVLCDDTHGGRLNKLVRALRREHKVTVKRFLRKPITVNRPLTHVIEDPQRRDSRESFLVQAADICAYAMFQRYRPHGVIHAAEKSEALIKALGPIIVRSPGVDEFGVLEI